MRSNSDKNEGQGNQSGEMYLANLVDCAISIGGDFQIVLWVHVDDDENRMRSVFPHHFIDFYLGATKMCYKSKRNELK